MPAIIQDQFLELGPANLYVYPLPKAELTTTLTGSNNDITLRARRGGVLGNSLTLTLIDPPGNNVPLSVVVLNGIDITVTLETDGSSAIVTTGRELADAINQTAASYQLVYAVMAAGNDGSGVVTALAETPLAGGSDTGVERFLGALSDETSVNVSSSAAPLTAHLTGNQPRDKVTTGGVFQIVSGLKEITLENFALGFANAILLEGAGGLQRLDFTILVGESLRRSRATRLELRKVIGGTESANPNDILVVPECSPVDAQVTLPFNVTEQRIINVTLEAWPDGFGRLAYFGTAVL
jgi:hypothetical protein